MSDGIAKTLCAFCRDYLWTEFGYKKFLRTFRKN